MLLTDLMPATSTTGVDGACSIWGLMLCARADAERGQGHPTVDFCQAAATGVVAGRRPLAQRWRAIGAFDLPTHGWAPRTFSTIMGMYRVTVPEQSHVGHGARSVIPLSRIP